MCSFVDEQIGRILAVQRARPDAQRTVVVFVSDHGDFCWHHGLCKKDLVLYDDLLRVPAIISWPAEIKPQVVRNTMSEHVDMLPTLLELAGIEIPNGCEGRSMVDLLRGAASEFRDEVHAEVCYPAMRSGFHSAEEFRRVWQRAHDRGEPLGDSAPFNVPGDYTKGIRTHQWKYIWFGDGFEELYAVREDPDEKVNLAGEGKFAATLEDMRRRMSNWLDSDYMLP